MKVLATTSQSILLVDCVTGHASVLHRGAGLYYGIARIGSMFAVAARRRLVSSPIPRIDERGCILLFDRHFRLQSTLEAAFPLRDIHQIAWFDDRLWVTCSFDDLIAKYDGAGWEQWIPEQPSRDGKDRFGGDVSHDSHHFNSFFIADDEFALLAHNHGPSDLHFYDRRSSSWRRSIVLGRQAHNVWRDDDAYAICSSIEGKLVASNGWELQTGGFPRGVCFGAAHRAIGISPLSERGERDWASAAIALYDACWRSLHYVHLMGEGMILDLAPIAAIDAMEATRGTFETCRFPLLSHLADGDLLGGQGSPGDVSM
ncbi:MAG: hypothetical protein ABI881_00020 [Betaproteobacteria bacterium]